jgi:hypothetical protein
MLQIFAEKPALDMTPLFPVFGATSHRNLNYVERVLVVYIHCSYARICNQTIFQTQVYDLESNRLDGIALDRGHTAHNRSVEHSHSTQMLYHILDEPPGH